MANATIHVDVVSAEESIFSGEAQFVVLPGEAGELGIYPRHTPLITRIRPGEVRIKPASGGVEELIFVAGGILEVQPGIGTRVAHWRPSLSRVRRTVLNEHIERLVVDAKRLGLEVEEVVDLIRHEWQ